MSDSIIGMLLTVLLLNPTLLWAREIRQKSFSFIGETVRFPMNETFIITAATSSNRGPCVDVLGEGAFSCRLLVAHFQLGSAELGPEESDQLLAGLRRCITDPAMPLTVTGHACVIGQDKSNVELSRLRAESVAAALRSHGYTVIAVDGVGSRSPMAAADHLELNRRVEVAATQP